MGENQANVSNTIVSQVNSGTVSAASGKYPRMASFSERLGAWIIDYLIILAISILVSSILNPGYFMTAFSAATSGNTLSNASTLSAMNLLGSILTLIVFFGYFGYFYTTKGQTLGKMALKIKVVRSADLKYLTWPEVIIRELMRAFVSGLVLSLGYFWYFMSPKRQTWHDIVGSSYVVKTDDAGNLLMDGSETYPKEPIKTFGFCGGCGLIITIMFALFVYSIMLLAGAVSEGIKNESMPNNFEYEYDSDMDVQYNFEFNGETTVPLTEEELELYFEQNFSVPENEQSL